MIPHCRPFNPCEKLTHENATVSLSISVPCPPEPVRVNDNGNGTCSLSWNSVPYADNYTAYSKRDDGMEEMRTSNGSSCTFSCRCGYSYIMSVFANNQAGTSPQGPALNQTTCM